MNRPRGPGVPGPRCARTSPAARNDVCTPRARAGCACRLPTKRRLRPIRFFCPARRRLRIRASVFRHRAPALQSLAEREFRDRSQPARTGLRSGQPEDAALPRLGGTLGAAIDLVRPLQGKNSFRIQLVQLFLVQITERQIVRDLDLLWLILILPCTARRTPFSGTIGAATRFRAAAGRTLK